MSKPKQEYFDYSIKLTSTQNKLLSDWQNLQDHKVAAQQKGKYPHYGVGGGAYSWIIIPTTMGGTIIHVENSLTKERIDLTDYDSW